MPKKKDVGVALAGVGLVALGGALLTYADTQLKRDRERREQEQKKKRKPRPQPRLSLPTSNPAPPLLYTSHPWQGDLETLSVDELCEMQLALNVFSFLSLPEVCRLKRVNRSWRAFCDTVTQDRSYLHHAARGGIPPQTRGHCWKFNLSSCMRSAHFPPDMYQRLAHQHHDPDPTDEHTLLQHTMIGRDLARTFPEESFFRSIADCEQSLGRLLVAYAQLDIEVGYVQGMNCIGAVLLLQLGEEDAFWVLDGMMHHPTLDLRSMFVKGLPRLRLCLYQFECLFARHLPRLYEHFQQLQMHPQVFAAEWFMTLFSYTAPPPACLPLWDLFLTEGWPSVHRVGLALLALSEDAMLGMDLDSCVRFFKDPPGVWGPGVASLISRADTFPVDEEVLFDLHVQHLADSESLLAVPDDSWISYLTSSFNEYGRPAVASVWESLSSYMDRSPRAS